MTLNLLNYFELKSSVDADGCVVYAKDYIAFSLLFVLAGALIVYVGWSMTEDFGRDAGSLTDFPLLCAVGGASIFAGVILFFLRWKIIFSPENKTVSCQTSCLFTLSDKIYCIDDFHAEIHPAEVKGDYYDSRGAQFVLHSSNVSIILSRKPHGKNIVSFAERFQQKTGVVYSNHKGQVLPEAVSGMKRAVGVTVFSFFIMFILIAVLANIWFVVDEMLVLNRLMNYGRVGLAEIIDKRKSSSPGKLANYRVCYIKVRKDRFDVFMPPKPIQEMTLEELKKLPKEVKEIDMDRFINDLKFSRKTTCEDVPSWLYNSVRIGQTVN